MTGPTSVPRSQRTTFQIGATDPSGADRAAGFVFLINWGDGSRPQTLRGRSGLAVAHTYYAAGTYTITLTATDQDGKSRSIRRAVRVGSGSGGGLSGPFTGG